MNKKFLDNIQPGREFIAKGEGKWRYVIRKVGKRYVYIECVDEREHSKEGLTPYEFKAFINIVDHFVKGDV